MIVHYFSADWCGPCKVFKPIVQQVSQQTGVPVNYVNVDYDVSLTERYSVKSIPTIVIVDAEGTELFRRTGAIGSQQLTETLSKFR